MERFGVCKLHLMDPELLEKAIIDCKAQTGKYPKAIVPVALYGMPYDCERIMAIANKYGIPVVEDAAEGMGSRFDGQVLGTFGRFGVLCVPLRVVRDLAIDTPFRLSTQLLYRTQNPRIYAEDALTLAPSGVDLKVAELASTSGRSELKVNFVEALINEDADAA